MITEASTIRFRKVAHQFECTTAEGYRVMGYYLDLEDTAQATLQAKLCLQLLSAGTEISKHILEGQGDLVSRLIIGISGVTVWLIGFISILGRSPGPPSSSYNCQMCRTPNPRAPRYLSGSLAGSVTIRFRVQFKVEGLGLCN